MAQNYPKGPKNDARSYALFPQFFLTEKAVPQTFSLLECMNDRGHDYDIDKLTINDNNIDKLTIKYDAGHYNGGDPNPGVGDVQAEKPEQERVIELYFSVYPRDHDHDHECQNMLR